jgi:hypothetical protein
VCLFDKIDLWPGYRTWAALASRKIETSDLFCIVQFHAYINLGVHQLVQDASSTGASTRSYNCKGFCGWSILFRIQTSSPDCSNNLIHRCKMDNTSTSNYLSRCQCPSDTIGITGPTLVNMSQSVPQFLVRRLLVATQFFFQKTAISLLKVDGIHVRFNSAQFSKCTVAATKYISGVLVPREFAKLPSFLYLLAKK